MKSMDTMPREVWDIMRGVELRDNGIKVFYVSVLYNKSRGGGSGSRRSRRKLPPLRRTGLDRRAPRP